MSNIQDKIEELRGTSNSLDLDEFSIAELEVLDEHIFQCSQCGWWCPIEEEVGESTENICEDCKEHNSH